MISDRLFKTIMLSIIFILIPILLGVVVQSWWLTLIIFVIHLPLFFVVKYLKMKG